VPGSTGARSCAWAWLGTASQNHYLLIRRHLVTGELAYHYCHVPPGRPVTLRTLVRVACLRWPETSGQTKLGCTRCLWTRMAGSGWVPTPTPSSPCR
jgi:hypothetical protein